RGALRDGEMLLIGSDVNEAPRDFREHVELGDGPLGVEERRAGRRGIDAQVALVAELDDLRDGSRRLGGIEAACAAGAESVLNVGLELERRSKRRCVLALLRGAKAR